MQQFNPRAKLQVHVSNNRDRIRKNLITNLFAMNLQHTPRFPQQMKSDQSTDDVSQDGSKSSPKIIKKVQMFVDVGQNFDQIYQLGKTIGQGAHAIVKLAYKINNPNRIYAVKIFRTSDPEVITTIRRTYQIGRMLNHENIVQLKDLFINESNGYSHLLMNYLPFPSLQNKLHLFKGNEELTRALIYKLTQTIVHMHHYGVCHRDLKPDNILVQIIPYNGRLILEKMVIIDLGVSKKFKVVSPGGKEPELKEMWTSTGTQVYCAPEIFQGGGYSQKIDVWAIGVLKYLFNFFFHSFFFYYLHKEQIIMFQCLTGTLPFKDETILDTIDKILYQNISFNSIHIELSKMAQRLISILLTKDPKNRPHAKAIQKDLWFNTSPSMKVSRDDLCINNKIANSSLFGKNLTQSTNMDEKQLQDQISNIEVPTTHLSFNKSENDLFKIKYSDEIYQKLQ